MYQTSSNFSISCFRHRLLAWIMLTILCFSFVPSISLAQQPTATIKTLSGNVLVSGQAAAVGAVLNAGSTIQTQAGASVVLELSDGSEIHLGENTQINMADLTKTTTGERVSRLKLLRGWLRAFLSPDHQKEGSSFTIETPNAQVGVKFSQPDVEVSYDPEKQETIGIAHTVELIAINLLTNEKIIVPVGSSVIIIGLTMKVITGTTAAAIAAGTETAAAETTTGMGTGTKVAIGAGALAAAGGVAAVAAGSGGGDDGNDSDNLFTGIFVTEPFEESDENGTWINTITVILTQTGTSVNGTMEFVATGEVWPEGTSVCTVPLSGIIAGTSAVLSWPGGIVCERPWGDGESGGNAGTANCTIVNDGRILSCTSTEWPQQVDFIRQ